MRLPAAGRSERGYLPGWRAFAIGRLALGRRADKLMRPRAGSPGLPGPRPYGELLRAALGLPGA